MPQVLMKLMCHADITTTLKYYVGQNADAAVLWDAAPDLGDKFGDIGKSPLKKPLKNKLGN